MIGFGFTSDWVRRWRKIFSKNAVMQNQRNRDSIDYRSIAITLFFIDVYENNFANRNLLNNVKKWN